MIILKLTLKRCYTRVQTEFIWSVVDSCEHGNENSFSIKAGDLFNSWATISFSRR